MSVILYRVGFLPDLLAPFATLRSLLEVWGSTSNYADSAPDHITDRPGVSVAASVSSASRFS